MRAIVDWFNDSKGFGFAHLDDGRSVFIHYSDINMRGHKTLTIGQRISLDLYVDIDEPGERLRGRNITIE